MSMDFFETVQARRSVRKFQSKAVPDAALKQILSAALLAPSAGNVQPWKFYVIREQETKALLARAAFGQQFLAKAPAVIVVTTKPELSASKYGERGSELYSIQDTAAAVEHILLSATALGLGGCWVGAFDEEATSQTLELSPTERPVAIIPLGYPDYKPRARSLKSFTEVVVFD